MNIKASSVLKSLLSYAAALQNGIKLVAFLHLLFDTYVSPHHNKEIFHSAILLRLRASEDILIHEGVMRNAWCTQLTPEGRPDMSPWNSSKVQAECSESLYQKELHPRRAQNGCLDSCDCKIVPALNQSSASVMTPGMGAPAPFTAFCAGRHCFLDDVNDQENVQILASQ